MKKVSFTGRLDARLIDVESGEILLVFKDDGSTSDLSAKVAGGGTTVDYPGPAPGVGLDPRLTRGKPSPEVGPPATARRHGRC